MDRALELHRKATVVNGLSVLFDFSMSGLSTYQLLPKFHQYVNVLRKGGVTAVNFTVAINESCQQACRNIAQIFRAITDFREDRVVRINEVEDICRAKRDQLVGLIFGFQNVTPIEDCLDLLWLYDALGVKIIQPVYNARSLAGDGCFERTDAGLSEFGMELVGKMNQLGILVDASHCGSKTTLDIIETSSDPVAITHSSARHFNPLTYQRSKNDEHIKALAEKGGVMGVIAESTFLASRGYEGTTIDDILAHINYVVDLVGVDHVGIGSDIIEFIDDEFVSDLRTRGLSHPSKPFDVFLGAEYLSKTRFETFYPREFDTLAKSQNLTMGLVAAGYSDNEILKILGGNFLQLFARVWKR
jgi:membrane dipeptidase